MLSRLRVVRRSGVAVNQGRSEQGIVAVGRAVLVDGEPIAAVSVAMPGSRYRAQRLPEYDAWLRVAAAGVEAALEADGCATASLRAAADLVLNDPSGVGVAGGHDALDGAELGVVAGSVDHHEAGGEAGACPRVHAAPATGDQVGGEIGG